MQEYITKIHEDKEVSELLLLYKKCYNIIAIVIFSVGMLCLPFLKGLIGDVPDIKESIYLIYILFFENHNSI